jgi:hypothetical protein
MNIKKNFNNKSVIPMSDHTEMATSQERPRMSDYRYDKVVMKLTLLRSMNEIDNQEVKRLISLCESPDYENWVVAEECIKQKLAV